MARSRQTGRQAKKKKAPTEEGKQDGAIPNKATKPAAKHKTPLETGKKIYACLHTECNETFEVWGKLNNHMDICKVEGIRCTGKRKMGKSRKKGNQLIALGVVAKKEYPPLPTDAEGEEADGYEVDKVESKLESVQDSSEPIEKVSITENKNEDAKEEVCALGGTLAYGSDSDTDKPE